MAVRWAVLMTAVLASGCVTTSQSKSEYQAELNALKAQIQAEALVREALAREREQRQSYIEEFWIQLQQHEGRRSHRPGGGS